MKQKEVWLVDLNPVKGSEQRGVRPVVVISGNSMNNHLNMAIVCPLSSKIKHYPGCITLTKSKANGLSIDSEVIVFQIRTIDASRFVKKLGEVEEDDLRKIKLGLLDVLKY